MAAEPTAAADDRQSVAAVERRAPVAEREVLLFFDDDEVPETNQGSVLESAVVKVLERLDPLEQQGAREDPLTGRRLLPGIVSLTPISLTAFFLNAGALILSMLFSLQYAPSYLVAFSIFHAVFFGHLWTYYVAYRTRRRFLGVRQVLFIVALVAFVVWAMLDLIEAPPAEAAARARLSSTYEAYLWCGIVLDSLAALLIFAHWAVLGRGYREAPVVPRPGGRLPPAAPSSPSAARNEKESVS